MNETESLHFAAHRSADFVPFLFAALTLGCGNDPPVKADTSGRENVSKRGDLVFEIRRPNDKNPPVSSDNWVCRGCSGALADRFDAAELPGLVGPPGF